MVAIILLVFLRRSRRRRRRKSQLTSTTILDRANGRRDQTFAPRHLPLQKITIADVCMLSGLQQDSEVDGRGVVNCP